MKVQYELSVSELKALIELIQELCKRSGLDEAFTKSLMKRWNEEHLR